MDRDPATGVKVPLDRLREALAERSLALDREIGRGGMSSVYLAQDLRHQRRVAVKVLGADVPLGADRFIQEIRVVSPLVHPHIIPLYDSGAVDGRPFFIMPFIEGESLRRRLQREGRLPIADAVQLGVEIAEALEFAHTRGVLHRDIKPENVLLQAGHALVADFGVARALRRAVGEAEGGERLTESGVVLGTAEYMSPEQASGDPDLDGRADLYSLGCVMYEMLTGAPPFAGGSAHSVVARRFREEPRPVEELRPEISRGLAHAVARMLASDPVRRYQSGAEVLQALRSAASPAGRRAWRSRWPAGLVAGAALTVLAIYGTRSATLDPHRVVIARMSNETGDSTLSYLGSLAADRLTAALTVAPGVEVVTSARVIPSRLTTGLQVDSLDDPARLLALAQETGAGTLISGSYFKAGQEVSFQAEISDANAGVVLAVVGPVSAPAANAPVAMDSVGRGVAAAIRVHLRPRG